MGNLDTFATELREALALLYDPLYQPSASLCKRLANGAERSAGAVQSAILSAIQAMKPDASVPEDAASRRLYNVLRYRYVEGLTQEASAQALGVSARYLRRLQDKAVVALAQRLCEASSRTRGTPSQDAEALEDAPPAGNGEWSSQLERELLSLQKSAPDATAHIASSIDAVLQLAHVLPENRRIEIQRREIAPNVSVAMHPSALRQVLLRAIEEMVRGMAERAVTIGAHNMAGRVAIEISTGTTSESLEPHLQLVQKIVSAHGGTVVREVSEAQRVIRLLLPMPGYADRVAVLVVDDNDDLVTFYKAYVTGTPYDLTQARSVAEAMEMIVESPPDLVVLDVMLPDRDMDGWALLMHMRQDSRTERIPVIICSVIRDSELAQALGAAGFLPKPVRRAEFIRALDQAMEKLLETDGASSP